MHGRLRQLALACAVALCTSAALAPAGQAGPTPRAHLSSTPPLGGINIGYGSAATTARQIALARALHAKVVRVEVPWSAFEPNGPQLDGAEVASLDLLVGDAAAAGIKVILLTESAPCWASSAPASLLRTCTPGRPSKASAWAPSNPAPYAAFVAYLARRYGTKLAAIEIWNEPDQRNEDYFAGPNKAKRYAALLRAAYPAIKHANPSVPVLGGSLVGSNGVFLRALYAAGIKGYYDGLAVHFYTLTLASLRAFREVQRANGDSKPLWLDELGWSSCWPHHKVQQEQACVTAPVQATNITDTFRALARIPYVAAEALYRLQDGGGEDFGVLTEAGARKPAFKALARVLASPFGPLGRVTLSLRRRSGHVVASGSAPVGDYMKLEAFRGSTLRYRALFTLNRFNRYSLALPSALGTSGLRVRVYQESRGPATAAQKSI